ncbi:MAG TPA: hypothetical protein VJ890_21085 [Vineibacter sp.]|nr:hypothetical protein [Vineibacter sp.]
MRQPLALCEVCRQMGPFGFYAEFPDGIHGHLWSCPDPAHQVEVRAKAKATVRPPPVTAATQAVSGAR